MPRRSHSARIRSASAWLGVTVSWSAPLAAKTIVLAPAPVSSVAIPGCHGALDEVERLPGEPPELLLAVQARLLVHQLLGEAQASATTW